MTVFRKLQAARFALVQAGVKKTGHNKFGGWYYYELGDFIPAVHKMFDQLGLCGVFTFQETTATLTIYDSEDGTSIQFSTPIVYAEANKGQAIQMLGSTHTYLRRYLWLLAMELTETDSIDSEKQEEKPVKVAVAKKEEPKPKPIPIPPVPKNDMKPWEIKIEATGDKEWSEIVMDAAKVCLELTKSAEDVQNIFKTNRTLFDKLKVEHPEQYNELLDLFKKEKLSFKE
jgi:hypothetical protein